MKISKRLYLIAGFLTLSVAIVQGKDKSHVAIEGLRLGYTSDWIIALAEPKNSVDLLDIHFGSHKETVPNSDISVPDTTGFKMNRITPPKVDEDIEKEPNG